MSKSIMLVILLFPVCTIAQRDTAQSTTRPWWITFGYGIGNVNDKSPIAVSASGTVSVSDILLTPRVVYCSGSQLDVTPHGYYLDVGLLAGYGLDNGLWFGNASIGISYIKQRRLLELIEVRPGPSRVYNSEISSNVGIAWQIQGYSRFSRSSEFGLGLVFGGNSNVYRPAFFLGACLTIGWY